MKQISEWVSETYSVLCMRCCTRTNVDDDFLKERWELSFSRSRCLSNIKLPVLALILSFYVSAHPTTARYYWKLIFSLSFTTRKLCRSSCCIKTSEDDDDALICSTSPTFVALRLPEWICCVCVWQQPGGLWYINYHCRVEIHFHSFTQRQNECRQSRSNTNRIMKRSIVTSNW